MRANTDRAAGVRLVTDIPFQAVGAATYDGDTDSLEPFDFDAYEDPRDLVALHGRITAGLGVQLLFDRLSGETFVTVTLNGETETFPVPGEHANDAFEHPYCYGATLAL